MLSDYYYWFSGTALTFPLSFVISVIIGIIPLMDGKSSKAVVFSLLTAALIITGVGWYAAGDQERKSGDLSAKLGEATDQVKRLRSQFAELLVVMNKEPTPPLIPNAPEWVQIAYKELGQAEIPGPLENPHIVEYFKAIAEKNTYRDDVNEWASAFVEWSLNHAGIEGPKFYDPMDWIEWGIGLEKPILGCIVIMSFNGLHHVGFYFGGDDDSVQILGGNENDAVRIYRYPKSSVFGYRWPPTAKLP